MKYFRAALAASALTAMGAMTSGASALPLVTPYSAPLANNIENVRLVCDVYGRCFRTPPRIIRTYPGPLIGVRPFGGPEFERRRFDERTFRDGGDRGRKMQGDRGDRGERDFGQNQRPGGNRGEGGQQDQRRKHGGQGGQKFENQDERGQGFNQNE